MRPKDLLLIMAGAILMLVLVGCGGNASPAPPATATPAPTAPTTPPPPTTPPATPPPSGGGSSTSGTVQYQVTLHADGALVNPAGSVTVMTNGDVQVSLTGGGAATSYTVSFCLYPAATYNSNCMTGLATLVTDSSGSAQVTFHFPKSGNWAGIFHIMNGTTSFAQTSGTNSSFAATTMQLEPASATNPQGTNFIAGSPQDPATGNIVAPGNGSVHVALSKGAPNATYDVTVAYMGGSSSYHVGNLMTNATGDGAADFQIDGAAIAIFQVDRSGAAGLVTGFHVP